VSILELEKAKNIEVVECTDPQSPYRFLIIASPYNDRHGQALTETVRRYFCKKYYFGVSSVFKGLPKFLF
jgi:ribosomal silencing factor RsfS